jgi:hypothetical protein
MSLKTRFRFLALFAPSLLFVLALTAPYSSTRLSLVLQGHPFARVVPKEKLNIFEFVSTDSFACRAIVFSRQKAIGWIDLPSTGGFARFIPFSGKPDLGVDGAFSSCFEVLLTMLWVFRWWLLPVQAIILLLWLRSRRRSPAE